MHETSGSWRLQRRLRPSFLAAVRPRSYPIPRVQRSLPTAERRILFSRRFRRDLSFPFVPRRPAVPRRCKRLCRLPKHPHRHRWQSRGPLGCRHQSEVPGEATDRCRCQVADEQPPLLPKRHRFWPRSLDPLRWSLIHPVSPLRPGLSASWSAPLTVQQALPTYLSSGRSTRQGLETQKTALVGHRHLWATAHRRDLCPQCRCGARGVRIADANNRQVVVRHTTICFLFLKSCREVERCSAFSIMLLMS
mmetsp:Transcript_17413/g.44239  ORF Transcript_17413/g.44239 Transcript_17413/m.44239 type:complete len:249 (-) Transcript_17413:531-1277(-)